MLKNFLGTPVILLILYRRMKLSSLIFLYKENFHLHNAEMKSSCRYIGSAQLNLSLHLTVII